MEVDVELGARADVRDLAVAERDQVLGREARDGDVVDGEGRQARVGPADRDHRQVELEQPLGLVLAELDRDRDDAVDALAAQERLEDRLGARSRSAVRLYSVMS